MRRIFTGAIVLLALTFAGGFLVFRATGQPGSWESEISAYEKADRLRPPKPGTIVFTGSSSIRLWDTLAEDMQPLQVLNRGFGGSQIAEVNHYASRIILPYQPRAVVLYAGDNDLAWPSSKTPEQVFVDFKQFVEIIHSQLPETWIYFVSIKPSILRWHDWEKFQKTNALIAGYILTQPRAQFIDVDAAMLNAEGKPRPEIFRGDGLHMNAKGYVIWTSIIRPILLRRFENANQLLSTPSARAGSNTIPAHTENSPSNPH
jgi:lysophospholipase L1-like esterase